MSEERKRSVAPWIAGVALTVLLGLYVGAYYRMVRRVEWWNAGPPPGGERFQPIYPALPVGDRSERIAAQLFRPIHWIDRRVIRPDFWKW